jgi:exodeoxyribonuclease-1
MLFRYRARNWPDSLNGEEQQEWQQYRQQRLNTKTDFILSLEQFHQVISECRQQSLSEQQTNVLEQLEQYAQTLTAELCS